MRLSAGRPSLRDTLASFLILGAAGIACAQTAAPAPAKGAAKTPEPEAQEQPALARSSNPAVQKLLAEVQNLQSRHRYFDALAKLDEAEKLDAKDPNIPNVRGAIYLVPALRRFDEAKVEFEKALAMDKGALAPKFNLAELAYVEQKFAEAETAFAAIAKEYPRMPLQVRHLVVFKLFVSKVKQDKFPEAEALLKENFSFMDDTPAYYFAKAAMAFQRKNEAEAQDWMTRAGVIFKPAETAAYVDSLMEARWLPNLALSGEQGK